MDKGAHFYKCDFQVHTPRDTNWVGPRPQTDVERKRYAEEFVAACRTKGLHAVAITDHHDVAYFRYLKEAAATETDGEGRPIPEDERLVVFPGMELTLGLPCQALLLLDADFPVGLLSSLNTVLASACSPPEADTHAEVTRLEHFKTIEALYECLDNQEHIRGRYIILPNVSEGGNSTILRSGFACHYKSMPCVGGYVDGAVSQWGRGNRAIIEGKNREYGNKSLGVFQTSDNRKATFDDLGRHVTWVKWAIPTAEAIRQACLAKSTRISHTQPELPPLVVDYVDVSNSRFLGPFRVDFNPQFNCLIGGRGTGKSTILEYVRWALCDQPPLLSDPEETSDFQTKRATLIEKTLLPLDAVVTVGFRVNNVPHVVRRNSRTQELSLKIDNAPFAKCTEDHVRDLLPVRAYSQKQLSAVGVRTDELVRFIQAPMKQELGEMNAQLNELRSKIRLSYGVMLEKRALQKETERDQLEIESLTKQLTALRGELQGITDSDQEVLAKHDQYLEEEQVVEDLDRRLKGTRDATEQFLSNVSSMSVRGEVPPDLPNATLLARLREEHDAAIKVLSRAVAEALRTLSDSLQPMSPFGSVRSEWRALFDAHADRYESAKQKAASQQLLLKQIQDIEARIKAVRSALATKKERLSKLGTPESEYSGLRRHWAVLFEERARRFEDKCKELTELSSRRISASLKRGIGIEKTQERLAALLAGTKIRGKKYEDLFSKVTNADDPLQMWERVLGELEALMQAVSADQSSVELPHTPLLDAANYTKADLEKIARKLTPQDWLELSLLELDDKPVFLYQQRENEYIRFEDASAGQQATALLRVLLNQEGPPLLIDQPEEDLDNQVILEIVEEIWKAKRKRQIIFTSHNANIVVNGDADLVVCCDYRTAGDQSGGRIKLLGAIDVPEIKKEITVVMEGGREAFRLRRDKYGF